MTRFIVRKAERLFVPVPDSAEEGMWSEGNFDSSRKMLTSKAITMIESAIREKQKYYWERIQALVTMLIGLGGVAIGLVSVLRATRH
jgi:hypothetical protein